MTVSTPQLNDLFPLQSSTHAGLRLQVVVAHPDDETFGCGSLLLHAAAAGVVTAVCCGTRGEAGEWPEEMVLPPGGIAEQRELELRAAADALGVRRFDSAEHLAAREAAIALHRSQTSPYEGLPPDL